MENKYFEIISRAIYVNKLHKRAIESQILDMKLSQGEHRILMYISRMEHCPSQKSLADAHCITPAAVTQILSSLEKKGLVVRHSSRDSRVNEIAITDKGRAIVAETKERFFNIDKEMFLGFSDIEMQEYYSFLKRLEENLDSLLGGRE